MVRMVAASNLGRKADPGCHSPNSSLTAVNASIANVTAGCPTRNAPKQSVAGGSRLPTGGLWETADPARWVDPAADPVLSLWRPIG